VEGDEAMGYPTDLTDKEWELIEHHFVGSRQRKYEKRNLFNAVLYLVKTGCQWRMLPNDYPPYKTVYSFYRRMRLNGTWETILDDLVKKSRIQAGRNEMPTYSIIDSQSTKTTSASEERGIDGGKKRKGASGI
jgi:putative transposase